MDLNGQPRTLHIDKGACTTITTLCKWSKALLRVKCGSGSGQRCNQHKDS